MLNFYPMFTDEHLSDVSKVDISLQGHCNTFVSHADQRGPGSSIFYMWLMRNGISNIISSPSLEKDGLRVTYDTLKSQVVHFPDGNPIFFKRDTGLCDQDPYVNVEYLNTIKCETFNMIQTVRRDFEGFTKREAEKANIACKAQTILGSLSEI